MTRLEEHKVKFELDERRGQLLRIDELTGDELAIINSSFFERIRRVTPETLEEMYQVYLTTLHEWGVMCPHPMERRDYENTGPDDSRWYNCGLCKASVIHG